MVSKHVYGPLVILMRILPVLLSMPERGDFCQPVGVPDIKRVSIHYVLHINETTREERCCKPRHCTAGTEVVFCSKYNSSDTSCRPCPPGYYSSENQESYMNPLCRPWRKCRHQRGLLENGDGTSIHDMTCRCDVSRGFHKDPLGACYFKTEMCEPDHELDINSGKCEPCRAGTEQPEKGYGPCRPCKPHFYKKAGQLRCKACPNGTFKPDDGSGACLTCKKFKEKNIYVPDCEKNGVVTPKNPAGSTQDDNSTSATLAAVLSSVFGFIFLVVLVSIVACVIYKRRRNEKKAPSSPIKKPVRSPVHAAQPYTAVPDNSSSSSADDALEVFKAKDQNMTNAAIQNINECKIPPQSPPADDGLPNEGYDQGQPNGHPAGGGMNGYLAGGGGAPNGVAGTHIPPGANYHIYAAPNCAIMVGANGTIHNQTLGGAGAHMGNAPGQGAPQNVHHLQRAAPDCDGGEYSEGDPYEDPADRIAAQYAAGGTPC